MNIKFLKQNNLLVGEESVSKKIFTYGSFFVRNF